MNITGWIMIGISWIVIFSLVIFCYGRIFKARKTHMRAPLEIDTEEN
jgi:hypothetical protein